MSRRFGEPADWALAGLLGIGVLIVLLDTAGMGFFADDWDFVVARRGLSAHVLLDPHGPHLSVVPILVYKVLLAVFGGGSYLPFRLLAAFDLTLLASVLAVVGRRRWGRWWSLVPVAVLVTLGPGAVSLLWSFQAGFALAVGFGVISLLALSRRQAVPDAIGCLALIVSLGSASQGVGFVVGAAFVVVLTGDWRRRAWTVLVPAALYALWYVTIGHRYGQTELSLWPSALGYEMSTLGVTIAAICGLSSVLPATGTLDATYAAPLAVVAVATVAVGGWRGWRPPSLFWGAAATAVVVWLAAALSDFPPYGRPATEPRYLASDAVLVLICLCAGVPRPRLPRGGVIIAALVVIVVCATNLHGFRSEHGFFRNASAQERAELGGLELMRPFVDRGYTPGAVDPDLANVTAGPFFAAVRAFGLREDDVAEIERAPVGVRDDVDRVLEANELSLIPRRLTAATPTGRLSILGGAPRRSGPCAVVSDQPLELSAPASAYTITAPSSGTATVAADRFGTAVDALGSVTAATTGSVVVHGDLAPRTPWRLQVTGPGARVCVAS